MPGEQPAAPIGPQPADAPTATRLPATPELAVRRAAEIASNWTARNAGAQQARLAALATGPARRDALQAAARLPTDPQLAAGHASGSGRVAAIALHPGTDRRDGLVVTDERLTVDGATQQRWRVTLVTVTRLPRGWAVERWEPQE